MKKKTKETIDQEINFAEIISGLSPSTTLDPKSNEMLNNLTQELTLQFLSAASTYAKNKGKSVIDEDEFLYAENEFNLSVNKYQGAHTKSSQAHYDRRDVVRRFKESKEQED